MADVECVFTLLWKIENFQPFERVLDQMTICSPAFNSRVLGREPFHLQVIVMGEDRSDTFFRILFVSQTNSSVCGMYYELSILGMDLSPGSVRDRFWQPFESFELRICPTLKQWFLPKDTLTVRCRILTRELPMTESVSCRTVIDYARHRFRCPVFGFSDLRLNQQLINPVTIDCSTWHLKKCPRNFDVKFSLEGESIEESASNISLDAVTVPNDVKVHVDVSLLDDERKIAKSVKSESKVFRARSKDSLLLPQLFTRRAVMDRPTVYLRGDVLALLFDITAYVFTGYVDRQRTFLALLPGNDEAPEHVATFRDTTTQIPVLTTATFTQPKRSFNRLVRDFRRIYQEGNLSDFELRLETETYPVHRAMLSARSSFFRDSFSNQIGPGYMIIQNTSARTLNRLLVYLYTCTVEPWMLWEDIADLYHAAGEYQVQPLRDYCFSILCCRVNVSNVGSVLKYATTHQDKELESFVSNFFLDRFQAIVESDEWRDFTVSDPSFAKKTVLEMNHRTLQRLTPLHDLEPRPTMNYLS